MAKNKKGQKTFCQECSNIYAKIVGFFSVWILMVLPLITDNYYFNVLETKYKFFWGSVVSMLVVLLGVTIYLVQQDFMLYNGENTKRILERLKPNQLFKNLTVPEIAMVAFLAAAIISTFQSEYFYESFWGNEGRYTGLFLMLIYGSLFFSVTKLMKPKKWYIDAFLVTAMIVCLWGITDYFQMDIMGFRILLQERQRTIFTSSLGNVNTYASYVGLSLGVAMTLFAMEKRRNKAILYYICTVIIMTALFMALSDSAYLAIGALYVLIPFLLFRSRTGIKRYVILLATLFSVIKGITLINQIWADRVVGLDSLFLILAEMKVLNAAVIALWFAAAFLHFYDKAHQDKNEKCSRWPVVIWGILMLSAVGAAAFLVWDANWGGHVSRYGALERYLVLDEEWGTHRGYIWGLAMKYYNDFPIMHKIFGYGPDTFRILTYQNSYSEMTQRYNEVFDSVHNEYLQYFVTIGIAGLTAYLTLLITSAVRMIKKAHEKPWVMAALFGCIAYGAQAFVNISVPVVAPIMWLLLMIGLAGCKDISEDT